MWWVLGVPCAGRSLAILEGWEPTSYTMREIARLRRLLGIKQSAEERPAQIAGARPAVSARRGHGPVKC